jgi:hypothetical protein
MEDEKKKRDQGGGTEGRKEKITPVLVFYDIHTETGMYRMYSALEMVKDV